ncbi:MAG: hypothetical protein SH817_16200 [Leptospira sp.]|nr:hypothetical protein [Leptospira sp.]
MKLFPINILYLLTLFSFLYCQAPDLNNSGDTLSRSGLIHATWADYIRPRSVCDVTSFEYAPNFRSTIGRPVYSPLQFVQAPDQSYYLYGVSNYNPEKNLGTFSGTEGTLGGFNATLMKFNRFGGVEWSRTLGLASTSGNSVGISLSPNGVYFVANVTQSIGTPISAFVTGGVNVGVFHISSTGTLLWNTYFGNNTTDNRGYSIASFPNGDVAVAGDTLSGGFSSFSGATLKSYASTIAPYASFVMRLKSDGTALWVHYFGGSGSNTRSADRIAISSTNTIWTLGYDSTAYDSAANKVVLDYVGSGTKQFVVTQFDENGTYLRHTFLPTAISQTNPILPIPIEIHGISNELAFGGITQTKFLNMDSVPGRAYSGSSDQFIIRFNSNLSPTYLSYLGSTGEDPGSIYRIFQDTRKDSLFAFIPYLTDPGFGSPFPSGAIRTTLVRVDLSGNLIEHAHQGETEFVVPLNAIETCDGGLIAGYYEGTTLDFNSSAYAKFRVRKFKPGLAVHHEYTTPFGPIYGP